MEHIYKLLRSFKWDCAKYLYKNTLNFKVKRLRRKKNIRVLFAVVESATWKSDCLYKAMAEHPRFTPSILVLPDITLPASAAKSAAMYAPTGPPTA